MDQDTDTAKMAELYRGQRSCGDEVQSSTWIGESWVRGKLCLLGGRHSCNR